MHESMSAIIGQIYDFVEDVDAADAALAGMASVLEADKAILVRLAEDRRRDIALARVGMDRQLITRILSERENPDAFLVHHVHWESGSIALDNQCKRSAEKRRKTQFYRDILAPNDIEHTLLGVVDSSKTHHVLLWFHRPRDKQPFDKTDRLFFESVMPHWQRAVHHKLAYDSYHSALSIAGIVLDQSPFGLYIIGRDHQVLYTNAAATNQCKSQDGIRLRNKSLVFSDRGVRASYEAMLAAAWHGGNEDDQRLQPIMFEKTSGDGSYQLGLRRLRVPGRRGSLATRAAVAMFIYDTGNRMELSIDSLKSLYDLTDAEARVCELLYKSRNLPEAANMLGISINTAKTHLNRSFRKVGVQSQAELVRRLNSQLYLS